MDTIECGSASGTLSVDKDGMGTAHFSGLLMPANFLAMGVLTMRAGVDRGARGLLYRNDQAAVCCDPLSMTASYPSLAPTLRALPVAFVINPAQAELYEHVVRRAAAAGMLRRTFLREDEARTWLARMVRTLDANQSWWGARRQPAATRGVRAGKRQRAAGGPAAAA